jgi:hypothetical protein
MREVGGCGVMQSRSQEWVDSGMHATASAKHKAVRCGQCSAIRQTRRTWMAVGYAQLVAAS